MAKPTLPSFMTCPKNTRSNHVTYASIYLIGLFYSFQCIGTITLLIKMYPENSNKIIETHTWYQQATIKYVLELVQPDFGTTEP
jgi:hypothetical protein